MLALSLAACGTAPSESPPAPNAAAPAITVAPLSPSLDARRPNPVPSPATRQQASVPPEPVAEPVNDDPRQLLRLSGKTVAALLGPASYVRRDGTAEIWQYRAAQCVLDVFLFQDSSGLSVAHVDLRERADGTIPARRCFGDLLASRK
ncbi:MAG: hypothetical protein WD767_04245 [Alphaproteobacteria bacterium]